MIDSVSLLCYCYLYAPGPLQVKNAGWTHTRNRRL